MQREPGQSKQRKPSRKEILIALTIGGAIGVSIFVIQHWPSHAHQTPPAQTTSGDPTGSPPAGTDK